MPTVTTAVLAACLLVGVAGGNLLFAGRPLAPTPAATPYDLAKTPGEPPIHLAPRRFAPTHFAHVSATAFAVAPGMVVTNAHVSLSCEALHLAVSVAAHEGPWRVAREDRERDLALLAGPRRPAIAPLSLSPSDRVPRDAAVLVVGYPIDGAGSDDPTPHAVLGRVHQAMLMVHWPEAGRAGSFRATDAAGHVIEPTWQDGLAYFGARQEGRMGWALEIAGRLGHGGSGGPVIDSAAGVVGVVVAGGLDEPFTSAITLHDLTDFLTGSGVVPRFAADPAGGAPEGDAPDWARTFETIAPSVVQVGC